MDLSIRKNLLTNVKGKTFERTRSGSIMEDDSVFGSILRDNGIDLWGVAGFQGIKPRLIGCSALKRLPERAASVIVLLLPYYSGRHDFANISKYAMPRDYHITAGEMIGAAAKGLSQAFTSFEFAPFCDASPVPEVEAARLAGLGNVGLNGLLINPEYGSYVFIGEIVTDMPLKASSNPGESCIGCSVCQKGCPTRALCDGRVDIDRCLSHISQKKGALTGQEEALLKLSGSIWGCDVCQDVCPMNRGAAITPIEAFKTQLVTHISGKELSDKDFAKKNRDRAFMWRGEAVLKRNLCIIESAPVDNNINSKKVQG